MEYRTRQNKATIPAANKQMTGTNKTKSKHKLQEKSPKT